MASVTLTVSTVKPLGDRVFVRVSEAEEKTAGGIILPDNAKEKPQIGDPFLRFAREKSGTPSVLLTNSNNRKSQKWIANRIQTSLFRSFHRSDR